MHKHLQLANLSAWPLLTSSGAPMPLAVSYHMFREAFAQCTPVRMHPQPPGFHSGASGCTVRNSPQLSCHHKAGTCTSLSMAILQGLGAICNDVDNPGTGAPALAFPEFALSRNLCVNGPSCEEQPVPCRVLLTRLSGFPVPRPSGQPAARCYACPRLGM